MSTLLQETREELGGETLRHCESRSLRLTRYARPDLKDDARKAHLDAVVAASHQRTDVALDSWHAWLGTVARPAHTIHAKLEARLLINMGGTVLENAGLQLDRFGTAYLPGSAVKACARRTALATLRQWCETGTKPGASADDALATVCATFGKPGDLLLAILRVFGCTDLEWATYEESGNDLAWACGEQWPALRDAARAALNAAPGCDPEEAKPTRRGTVAFLPAYPHSRPKADLELDVLTSHHPDYYGGRKDTATDTENPIPVYFPAVAAGATYAFAILSLGSTPATAPLLDHAKTWLLTGLTTFGLGAKTAAGYGWFSDVSTEIANQQAKEAEAKRLAAEEAARKEKQAADLAARKEREAQRAAMTPEQRADAALADRATDWGWMKQYLAKFPAHKPEEQAALLRWFTGAGKARWLDEIKPEAAKGRKPWSQIIGAIHAAKKNLKIDLP